MRLSPLMSSVACTTSPAAYTSGSLDRMNSSTRTPRSRASEPSSTNSRLLRMPWATKISSKLSTSPLAKVTSRRRPSGWPSSAMTSTALMGFASLSVTPCAARPRSKRSAAWGSAFMSRTWSMMPTSVTSTPRLRHASTVLSETMEVPLTSMRLHPGLVMASFRRSASSIVLSMMGSYPQSRGKPTGVGTEPDAMTHFEYG